MAGRAAAQQASGELIRAELDRMIRHPLFVNADRLRKFLEFTIEQQLTGRGDEIKELLIATEVYGRPASYDPQVDSIVRVEAARLRSKLRKYYETDGRSSPVRIDFPKGSYAPQFRPNETHEAPMEDGTTAEGARSKKKRRLWIATAAAGIAAIIGVIWWLAGHGADAASIRSVSVGPFVALGEGNAAAQFSRGLSDEIAALLTKNPAIRVGENRPGQPVDAVLRATLRRKGERARLSAQLVARDGFYIWAENFERSDQDEMALQHALAESVAISVSRRLAGELPWRIRPVVDEEAMNLYLRGQRLLEHDARTSTLDGRVPASLDEAIRLLEQAVQRSPGFARAWATLANAREFASDFDPQRGVSLRSGASAAARRAIEIDDTAAEAHAILGSLLFYREWKLPESEQRYRRAIELDPGLVHAAREYADLLRLSGRSEEAQSELARIMQMQPDSHVLATAAGLLAYDRRDYARAVRQAERAIALKSDYRHAHWLIGLCYERQRQWAAAEEKYRQVLAMNPTDGRALPALGHLLGRTGRPQAAREILARLKERAGRGEPTQYSQALIETGLGNYEAAVADLDSALRAGDVNALYVRLEQRFEPLASQTGFVKLLKQLPPTLTRN